MQMNKLTRCAPPIWAILLLSVALWGGEFLRRGLWEPDEARYAYVAQEMHTGNHWFVPHINGQPYPDKPPLMFWLINASALLTGGHINGVSARLPSLLGSILTLWAITRLLTRWHSAEAAWRAMLILLTTFLFWQQGSWGQIDALLCGLVTMSVYFFFTSLQEKQRHNECLAYLFAGLAVLAKGPVGLIVPMGIFAVAVASSGDARALKRSHWLWGPLLALSISALWLILAWNHHAPAEYFASMFGEKSFGRAVQTKSHHRTTAYFLFHFPVELMPWTIFLPAALVACSDKVLKRRLLAWIIFVVWLFSLFTCKRNLYIMAAYPAAAMLIAVAWDDIAQLSARWKNITASVAIVPLGFLALATTIASFVPQIPFNSALLLPSAGVLVFGSFLMIRLTRREPLSRRWLLVFCSIILILQATIGAIVLPAMNSRKSPIEAAEIARNWLNPSEPVYLYKQQLAIFPLYAERPGIELHSPEELQEVREQNLRGVIIFQEKTWRILQPEIETAFNLIHPFNMGRKRLILAAWDEHPIANSHIAKQVEPPLF